MKICERAGHAVLVVILALSNGVSAVEHQDTPPNPPIMMVPSGWKASWAPDGTKLVYGLGAGAGLEILDFATLTRTKVTESGKDPDWSPDGRQILFVREPTHNTYAQEELWLIAPDGSGERKLALGGYPSWANDRTVWAHSRAEGTLISVDVDSGEVTEMGAMTNSFYPAVSPGGEWVAYGAGGRLVVRERASGRVVREVPTPGDRGLLPSWSPDGQYVCFGGFDGGRNGLRVLDMETGTSAVIMDGLFTMPAWAKDGSRLAFDLRSGRDRQIWITGRAWIEARLRGDVPLPPTPRAKPVQVDRRPDSSGRPLALVGKPAPGFDLETVNGGRAALGDQRGRIVVVDFWATWCPPCRRGLPHLQGVAENEALRERGLRVMAVNVREKPDKIQRYLTANKLSFTVPMDTAGQTMAAYGVRGIPTTVVIDREGVVRDVLVGFGQDSARLLDEAIERALAP